MKFLKTLLILSLSLLCVACNSIRLSSQDKISELKEKVIGVWGHKDNAKDSTWSLEFITEDYRIWISDYKNVNYKGTEPMVKGPPPKHAYKISKEGSRYFLRTKNLGGWFEIMENSFNDSIKLRGQNHGYSSYYYKKLKDSEVLEILKDYDIDYELLKKTPIGFVDKDSFKNKELLNQLKDNKIPDNSLPPIMEEYIRINNIDVTKKSGRAGVSDYARRKDESSIDNFQSRKSQKEKEEIATEEAIKELKEQWNFPSLEKLKEDSAKLLAKSKEDKKHQNSQLKGIYKRNSTILRELQPYVSEEKPIAVFTYHCYFDGHRAFAIFEDKFITFSSKLTRTKTITHQSLFSKTISNSIVEEDIIKVDVFDKNNLSKSQYSKFKDLLACLNTNNEFLISDSGYFSPKLNTGITCMFSTRDKDKYHSFAIDDVYGLRDDDIRYLIYSKLTALYQEVHPDSKTIKVINRKYSHQ